MFLLKNIHSKKKATLTNDLYLSVHHTKIKPLLQKGVLIHQEIVLL
jgi:hypothetical protein